MKKIRIIPYGASSSVNLLTSALAARGADVKKIKKVGSTYRGNEDHFILNWGSSSRRSIREGIRIFNEPEAVAIASNKLKTFDKLTENLGLWGNLPRHTKYKEEAKEFIEVCGYITYCRTLLNSSKGRGIVIARTVEELVDAPLYVAKVPKGKEFRVHVFNGQVISYAQKKRRSEERLREIGLEEVNEDIRSFDNGWIFSREGISINESTSQVAVDAVRTIGLDFGAVDIVQYRHRAPIVLEINTAPGIEGTTLEDYVDAIWTLLS